MRLASSSLALLLGRVVGTVPAAVELREALQEDVTVPATCTSEVLSV